MGFGSVSRCPITMEANATKIRGWTTSMTYRLPLFAAKFLEIGAVTECLNHL